MPDITKTIASTAGFIPEIWANKALEVLRAQCVMARLVAKDTDFTQEFSRGDTLDIPYPGTFSANDKAADTSVTLQTPSGGTKVQVILNKHKEVSFLVEDVARAQGDPEILQRYIDAAVPALAEAIESDLFAEYANVTANVGTAATDITATTVRSARKTLNDAKVTAMNRHLVVSTKDEASLLSDSNLATYFANSKPQVITDGTIGRLYGFDIHMSQLVKLVSTTTYNLAFQRDAFVLAMRRAKDPPPQTGVQFAVIKDPLSGLMIRVIYGYNMTYLGVQVTMDVLYGVKTVRAAKAVQVKG